MGLGYIYNTLQSVPPVDLSLNSRLKFKYGDGSLIWWIQNEDETTFSMRTIPTQDYVNLLTAVEDNDY